MDELDDLLVKWNLGFYCNKSTSGTFTVAVAVVDRILISSASPYHNNISFPFHKAAKDLAKYLMETSWSFHNHCDNNIVIVFSVGDKKVGNIERNKPPSGSGVYNKLQWTSWGCRVGDIESNNLLWEICDQRAWDTESTIGHHGKWSLQ